jgi:hypothetical protein
MRLSNSRTPNYSYRENMRLLSLAADRRHRAMPRHCCWRLVTEVGEAYEGCFAFLQHAQGMRRFSHARFAFSNAPHRRNSLPLCRDSIERGRYYRPIRSNPGLSRRDARYWKSTCAASSLPFSGGAFAACVRHPSGPPWSCTPVAQVSRTATHTRASTAVR